MSDIIYGLISKLDAKTIETVLLELSAINPKSDICISEIGLYNGRTASGIFEFAERNSIKLKYTGIDNYKDKEELVFLPDKVNFIFGSSIEVYNKLPDNSQDLIIIDANHSFPYVIADFYCYQTKVKKGGYICFHDSAPHSQWKSYQRMGDETDPDMYIAVRKALCNIGLIPNYINADGEIILGSGNTISGWELAYDVVDMNDDGGGFLFFKKVQ